ncbi:MAG TPA: hypothetical protein DEA73_08595 [Peptococcaceae bacterium]|nr:hypothetical protein [Peptococcaceae bacterium]
MSPARHRQKDEKDRPACKQKQCRPGDKLFSGQNFGKRPRLLQGRAVFFVAVDRLWPVGLRRDLPIAYN